MSGAGEVQGAANGRATERTLELRRSEGAAKTGKLHEIAQGFESLFTSTLLGELMKPLQGAGFAGEGPGASVLQGLIETKLADHVASSGGLGIGRMVEQALAPLLAASAQAPAKAAPGTTKEEER